MEPNQRTPIPPKEKQLISLSKAKRYVNAYQKVRTSLVRDDKKGDILPMYEIFGKDAIMAILKQRGCAGIKIHGGLNAKGQVVFVIIGVDKNGKSITRVEMPAAKTLMKTTGMDVQPQMNSSTDGLVAEDGTRVPPFPGDEGI